MVHLFIWIGIIIAQIAVSHIKHWFLGAIIPFVFLSSRLIDLFQGDVELNWRFVVSTTLRTLLLLVLWADGRKSVITKEQNELEKMRRRDFLE